MDGQWGVVAVAGDNDEGVVEIAVHQCHRIDDEGDVGGVFSGDIVKLLLRFYGQPVESRLPVFQALLLPVAIGALDHNTTVIGYGADDIFQPGKLSVVRIDQQDDIFQFSPRFSLACKNLYLLPDHPADARYRVTGVLYIIANPQKETTDFVENLQYRPLGLFWRGSGTVESIAGEKMRSAPDRGAWPVRYWMQRERV